MPKLRKSRPSYFLYIFFFLLLKDIFLFYVSYTRVLNTFACRTTACSCAATIINSFGKFKLPKRWFPFYFFFFYRRTLTTRKIWAAWKCVLADYFLLFFFLLFFLIINIQNGIFQHFVGIRIWIRRIYSLYICSVCCASFCCCCCCLKIECLQVIYYHDSRSFIPVLLVNIVHVK